jgi:hypothetical protein
MNYTLVAYTSSGSTSCRGCIMDSWGSDFSMDFYNTKESVIEKLSEYYFSNYISEYGETELTILYDGLDYWKYEGDEYNEKSDLDQYIRLEAERLSSKKVEKHKEAKEESKRLEIIKKNEYNEKQELELLRELKQKYGEQ